MFWNDECPVVWSLLDAGELASARRLGRAFTPAVAARVLGVRPGAARALWGNPFGDAVPAGTGWILEAAECCPPDWLPARGDLGGWRGLRNALAAMAADGVLAGDPPRASTCPGGWTREAARRHERDRRAGRDRAEFPARVAEGGRAGARAVLSKLIARAGRGWAGDYASGVLPRMQAADTARELGHDLLACLLVAGALGRGERVSERQVFRLGACVLHHPRHPAAVRRVVERHHARLVPQAHEAPPRIAPCAADPDVWPPLLRAGEWRDRETGVCLVELRSRRDLEEEGGSLEHCVGSYGWTCAAGGGRIFSLRDARGGRLSTAMVRLQAGSLAVAQHSGRRNMPPPARARGALARFVEQCNGSRRADLDLGVLRAVSPNEGTDTPDTPLPAVDLVARGLGARWHDRGVLAVRWERWRALLDVHPDPGRALAEHFGRFPWPADAFGALAAAAGHPVGLEGTGEAA